MQIEVILPKVDMDMQHGIIVEWIKSAGDEVALGEPLFVIETDKATMEIESPGAGVLSDITAAINTPIPVGKTVAWIVDPSSTVVDTPETSARVPPKPSVVPPGPAVVPPGSAVVPPGSAVVPTRASPAARRLARYHGVDLSAVDGSSLRGRIVAADVMACAGTAGLTSDQPVAAAEIIPHSKMRRSIARRLQASTLSIPSFQLSTDIDCRALEETRGQLSLINQRHFESSYSPPTVNDFAIKALALALRNHPLANVSWSDDARRVLSSVDIGLAVALDDGVLAPIIRHADARPLQDLAAETRLLANKAREGKLAPDEYRGGASTISNLGMYGITRFTSIIVPPQASILSIGAMRDVPVVRDGQLVAGCVMTVTLTCDHRIIDGVLGAELLNDFQHYIENPAGLFIH